uniref:Uncharacterized protein n=1 Tax=uncultured bacterium Ele16D6 TaxID=1340030 RepID=W5RBA1_9BACT|nr:hypothetical protein [uncultured bacterium Ele16D6]
MPQKHSHKGENLETLRIQVEWQDAPWLRACPFHESQVEEVRAEDYSVFAYRLTITPEVKKRLEMISDFIEILEPEGLEERDEIDAG